MLNYLNIIQRHLHNFRGNSLSFHFMIVTKLIPNLTHKSVLKLETVDNQIMFTLNFFYLKCDNEFIMMSEPYNLTFNLCLCEIDATLKFKKSWLYFQYISLKISPHLEIVYGIRITNTHIYICNLWLRVKALACASTDKILHRFWDSNQVSQIKESPFDFQDIL